MVKVKICSIQEPSHAVAAAEAGADYIGLIFVHARRRKVTVETAQTIGSAISGDNAPRTVGIFADQTLDEVSGIVCAAELHLAQLCSGESLDYCNTLRNRTSVEVIRVFHVPDGLDNDPAALEEWAATMNEFRAAGHRITLDRMVNGLQGGTGQSFDWRVAASLSRQRREFLLAGGLTPDNVAEAVASARPWGVDVSSGVETGGVKDPDKIRAFIQNARAA